MVGLAWQTDGTHTCGTHKADPRDAYDSVVLWGNHRELTAPMGAAVPAVDEILQPKHILGQCEEAVSAGHGLLNPTVGRWMDG